MSEYTDCYVAFLDILGFKNLLKGESCDTIKRIFEALKDYEPRPLIKGCQAFKHIHYYIMSDSMVVYIDSNIEDSFIALTEVCQQIQIKLTTLDTPIFMRGAIAKGPLYCEGNVIFGQGLSDAYVLESTLAKYPRVIFTDFVREEALKNTGKRYILDFKSSLYTLDDDLVFYLDYLDTFDYIPFMDIESVTDVVDFNNKHFEKLVNYIEKSLSVETNPTIREKHLWLRKKLVERINQMPDVKKHFEEIERSRYEENVKRFDAALHSGKTSD